MQLERVWPVATAVCQLFNQAALTFVRSLGPAMLRHPTLPMYN